MAKELLVAKIKNGSVIDHIRNGAGFRVMEVLRRSHEFHERTALVLNVESKSVGKKDILKIEGVELTKADLDKIAILTPQATLNIIRNYEVIDKKVIGIPAELDRVISCPNPKCITRGVATGLTVFRVESQKPIILRCRYCERAFPASELSIL